MKRLLILSGKGGTGKTTVAAAFAKFSDSKALADCDVDAPNLHIVTKNPDSFEKSDFFGGERAVIDNEKCRKCGKCQKNCRFDAIYTENGEYKVNDILCEGCAVCAYVCENSAIEMIKDIAGEKRLYKDDRVFSTAKLKMGRGNSGKLVTEVKLALFKNAHSGELAIIDGSPGIGCPVIASVSGTDLALIVTEPTESGISDLKRLLKTADVLRVKTAVCVNKYDLNKEKTDEIENFCKENDIPFLGRIPYDKTASDAINKGISVAETDCMMRDALLKVYENTVKLIFDK